MAKYLNLDGLQTLWAKLKDTFLFKDSPAGQIFEFPYGSTDYSLDDLNQLASEGKTIRCVIDKGVRLTLYYIGPGPGDIDVAYFIGPFIPSTSGGYASFATMNSNKNWTGGTTQSKYSWNDLIGNQPAPIAHTHGANMAEITAADGDSDVTDGTDLVTSYADENGYTTGHPKVYRRKASKLWNYILGKLFTYNPSQLASNTTAASAKAWWAACPNGRPSFAYNNSGTEYALIANKDESGRYGTVLRVSYASCRIEMLRHQGGTWKSDDWECVLSNTADWYVFDQGETKSFAIGGSVLSYYSNIIVFNGNNSPAGTFTCNSRDFVYARHYHFNFPMGGTLRFTNNRGAIIYVRRNGGDGSINNGEYRDVTVSAGGTIEIHYNGGNAVFFSTHSPGSNAGTGGTFQPIYISGDGIPTACNFKIV